jgi:hypothetical protein
VGLTAALIGREKNLRPFFTFGALRAQRPSCKDLDLVDDRTDDLIVANYETDLRHRGGLRTWDGAIAKENFNFRYSIFPIFPRSAEAWRF